jgi:hypothetical protein
VFAWFKLPVGSWPRATVGPLLTPPGPKRSRLFTAAVLLGAGLLLALPEGREALRTVRASWLKYEMTNSDQRTLERLAARAEEERDVEIMAFVAVTPAIDDKRAAELAERTVALDPSFIWIYGVKKHRLDRYPAEQAWLERLHAADPDNAVPLLLAASARAEEELRPLYEHGGPTKKDFEKLGDDPQWMALMGQAYAAPKYDSYLGKHLRVMRNAWDRNPNLPPEMFLTGLWSHVLPNLHLMRLYAEIELNAAKKALAAGDAKEGESLARRIAAFGARMTASSGTTIEELVGIAISRMADKASAEIYASEGRTEEARRASAHGDQLDQTMRDRFARDRSGRVSRFHAFRREAALVQGFAILGGISLLVTVVGILWLELWRGKKAQQKRLWWQILCFAVDWAPTTLLLASGAFLVCFLPFEQVLADFRVASFQLTDGQRLTDAMESLIVIPEQMSVADWTILTVTLMAIAIFIVARGFYRSRRAQTKST